MKLFPLTASLVLLSASLNAADPMTAKSTPDPDMAGVLKELAELAPKPIPTLSPNEARKQPTPADAVKAYLKDKDMKASPEKVADVDNRSIDGPGGNIKIRVYTPEGKGPFPVIVYYHGGGFVIADLDTYDSTPRALANAAQAVVVSSHYRQGPEHKFPAAHEDAFAAYKWVLANADKIKGDPTRVAVAGESAGGNLASAVCLMARTQNVAMPVHQLLVYPVTDNDMNTPSYQENANAKPLDKPMMAWFFENAAKPTDAQDPRLALLKKADVKGLPPATIITAQIDPLRSEGQAYAEKLKAAGVPVNYRNFEGVTHEFFGMGAAVPKAKEAVTFAAADLTKAFSNPTRAAE
jgi:acetyl esterase